MDNKAALKTLIVSTILSFLGPIVLGIGLIWGRSLTQIADFSRKTAEFIAIFISLIIFLMINGPSKPKDLDQTKKKHVLESSANISVSIAMLISGSIVLLLAFNHRPAESNNVILPFIIAVLSLITNAGLWFRYMLLNRKKYDRIMAMHSKLYKAKTLVDFCVATALVFVMFWPEKTITSYLDIGGLFIVSLYLIVSGIRALVLTCKEHRYYKEG